MQVVVLASGSKGNAVYVEMDGTKLLIDAGISATRIKKRLAEEDIDVATLDGILVTHEHRDHIAGLATLSKWYHLPIFTRRGTIEHMSCRQAIPDDCFHPIEGLFSSGMSRSIRSRSLTMLQTLSAIASWDPAIVRLPQIWLCHFECTGRD